MKIEGRKIIKRLLASMLAMLLLVSYVPVTYAHEGGKPFDAISEYRRITEAMELAKQKLKDAEATVEDLMKDGISLFELGKLYKTAEEVLLTARDTFAVAEAESREFLSKCTPVEFYLETEYSGTPDNPKVSDWMLIGAGVLYDDGVTQQFIELPGNVSADVANGKIVETKRSMVGSSLHIDYKLTDTSVSAAFYALKEDKSVPTNEITSQSKSNYTYIGSGSIDTHRTQLFGQSALPSDIQDYQFDLAGSVNQKYVWYVVKLEIDGWHVDGYVETLFVEPEVVPPVEEEAVPPVEEEVIPPVEEEVIPPVEEEVVPPVEEEVIPPVEEEVIPPVEEEVIPPVKEEVIPPVKEEVVPPVEEEVVPPVEEEIIPPVEEEVVPPVEEEVIPPVEEEVIPPVEEEVVPPVEEEIIPPVEEEVVPPVEEEVIPPVKEEVVPPVEEEVVPPVEEEVIPPVKEEVVPPVEEEVVPPVEEEVIPPVEEEVIPPVKEEVISPVEEEVVPPAKEEVVPPVEEEVIPPVREEVVPPVEEEVIPPVKEEVVPPVEEVLMSPIEEVVASPSEAVMPPVHEPVIEFAEFEEEVTPLTGLETVEFEEEDTPLVAAPKTITTETNQEEIALPEEAEFEDEEAPLSAVPGVEKDTDGTTPLGVLSAIGSYSLLIPALLLAFLALIIATVLRRREKPSM